jgi:hypothetical protein
LAGSKAVLARVLAAGAVAFGLRVVRPSGAARACAVKADEKVTREAKKNSFIEAVR